MEDLKGVVAKNIAALRQQRGMTQMELAEELNYSDKAISKWERAESLPDVAVLKRIAELFQVPLDYLVSEEHSGAERRERTEGELLTRVRNRGFITGISVVGVWLLAALGYILLRYIAPRGAPSWLPFLYAVPVSLVVWLVLNSVWFNRRRNYLIISLLMWGVLAAVYLTLLPMGQRVGLVFALGIPGQIIILLASRLRYGKRR